MKRPLSIPRNFTSGTLIGIIACLFTASCEHNELNPADPPITVTPPDFKYQGANSVYSTINFEALNIPQGASVFWEFGDGVTATTVNAQHHYSVKGTYDISLQVIADSTYKIVKVLNILVASDRLAGLRHWAGTNQHHHNMDPPPNPIFTIDDSVASVNVVNDSCVTFLDTIRMFYLPLPDSNVITFQAPGKLAQISYYVGNDSMSYFSHVTGKNLVRNLYLHTK